MNKIIFFGSEEFSLASLRQLIEGGFDIVAVVTKPDSKRGRGQKLTPPAVKVLAQQYNIPVWQPHSLREITDDIKKLQPVTGVLVSYGKIIPQSTIDLFTPGIINVHPSRLPHYRGPSPVESAILHGDTSTAVSIMKLDAKMDAGPVYHQMPVTLTGTETGPELHDHLADLGAKTLTATLPSILDGRLTATPQDETHATYCELLQKSDGTLDPSSTTAVEAERKVRAFLNFPKTRLSLLDQQIIITKAHVASIQKTPLDVQFQDGAFLSIDELIAPSGKKMSASAFLNGYAA